LQISTEMGIANLYSQFKQREICYFLLWLLPS